MAAINSPFYDPENGWMAMDQMTPEQNALMNPGSGRGFSTAGVNPNDPYYQFTQFGGNQAGAMPNGYDPYAVSNGIAGMPNFSGPNVTGSNQGGGTGTNSGPMIDPATVFNNANRSTQTAAPANNPTPAPPPTPSPSPSPSPNPTYPTGGANSLPMGSENVGGMGMYTGANAPLDTTRFTPATNQANVWYQQHMGQNPGNVSYMQFADELGRNALNAAGGQWTGGDSIATQQQYLNSQAGQQWMSNLRSRGQQQQPTQPQQPNPAQYSGPQPPLPQQPQPFYNPAMPSAQPSFNPAMAYQLPQVDQGRGGRPQFQNPFGLPQNPFTTMQNPGMGSQFPLQITGYGPPQTGGGYGQQPGMGRYRSMDFQPGDYGYGDMIGQPAMNQMNGQQNLQQMIAYAMSQGALGGQQYGSAMGYPSQFGSYGQGQPQSYMQQQGYGQQASYAQLPGGPQWNTQQQPQQQSWSGDPGMNQARAYDMYGGGGQQSAAPQADFRAATFGGGGGQQTQQTQAPSFSQQFSTPQSSTSNASNPWGNVSNRLPSLTNRYNYMWGR